MKKLFTQIFCILVLVLSSVSFVQANELNTLGNSCSTQAECGDNFVCRDSVCARAAGEGTQGVSCSTGSECATGFECRGNICTAAQDTGGDDVSTIDADADVEESPSNTTSEVAAGEPEASRTLTYTTFTSFPGVGQVTNLCQLTDALWQLGIIVLITSVFGTIVYAGFKYVTAGVNVNGVSEAKQRFGSAVTGLILGLSSVLILSVLNADLLNPTCTLEFVGAGTNAFENFDGTASTGGSDGGAGASGPVPPAGTPCDDNSGLTCLEPGSVSAVAITSCYYRNSWPYPGALHAGTDWVVQDGSPSNIGPPVAALTAGVVLEACTGRCGGWGNSVILRGPSQGGYDIYNYSHLESIAPGIEAGVQVGQGTILGAQGSTGMSTGAHVDTKISNCVLCKADGNHYKQPTGVLRQYIEQVYGVTTSCGCRNNCNDT